MARTTHTTIATVQPTGIPTRFPLDMLRYDLCFPQRQIDVESIYSSLIGQLNHKSTGIDEVVINVVRTDGLPFTEDRWRSFGWRILSIRKV